MSGKSGQGSRRVIMASSMLRPSEASKTDDERSPAGDESVDQVVIASLQKQLELATIALKKAEAENERLGASVAMRESVSGVTRTY